MKIKKTFAEYYAEAKANPIKKSYAQTMATKRKGGDWAKAMRKRVVALEGDNTKTFFQSMATDRSKSEERG